MVTLIIAVIFGLVFSFFAIQNSVLVPLSFLGYRFTQIPLYVVILSSLFMGLFIAFLISLVRDLSALLLLRQKDSKIRQTNQTISQLTKRIHDLEIENAKIKGEHPTTTTSPITKPTFSERLRNRLSF